jgi:WD40 repeat protein
MTRLPLLLAAIAASLAIAAPASAAGPAGSLTQLAGNAGCTTDDGSSNAVAAQCADGRGLIGAEALTLSPDGRFAYSYSYDSGAIAILARDASTGALSEADDANACVARSTLLGDCTAGRMPSANSDTAHAIAITPDGSFLFAAGATGSIISVFSRDASTGALVEVAGSAGCVSVDGKDANGGMGSCSTFASVDQPQALAVSPDGKFLYASGFGTTGLTIYSVGATGALTPLASPNGCVTAVASPGCLEERYAAKIYDITLSPDGRTLYAVHDNLPADAVLAFTRDAGTGAVTQPDTPGYCVYNGGIGTADPCTAGHGLGGLQSVEVSPDGKLVVTGGSGTDGLAVLHRDPATGELSQSAGAAGCVNIGTTDGCGLSRQTTAMYRTLFTPDSRTLFAAGYASGSADNSGISVFDIAADGKLVQRAGAAGCFSASGKDSTGAAGGCTTARAMRGPIGFALSADGAYLYESSYGDNGVAAFRIERAPTCSDASASTAFGTAVAIPATCTDANGDSVTLAGVDGPAHGSVAFAGLTATYTPAAGFSGDDVFRVKGNDGANDSAPATVTVHVGAAPPPPAVVTNKKAAKKLSIVAKPKRDRTLPFKFTFSGKLTPATGTTCSGKVALTVKRGKKTVAKKTAKLSSKCKWKTVVKFKDRKKLGKKRSGKLVAKARYAGNKAMNAKSSKALTVRYG